ncbi:hypothetical protein MKK58_08445 [Methylobacterium sp. J-078]|uniref:hypothetical protein n=1 Tax=Methylobacterium sp. J-078 TaxID=2836657 RepID=UPI001FB93225|nr:hypothetical protein [Methylobacterium sp. J-078]MCJ2044556.1 hypothetical protein [Methylobacterium sp. J-078]
MTLSVSDAVFRKYGHALRCKNTMTISMQGPMFAFRLQIRSTHAMIWQAPEALETSLLAEAMQIADRLAKACRRTAASSCNATRSWVVEIFDEANGISYRAPVSGA